MKKQMKLFCKVTLLLAVICMILAGTTAVVHASAFTETKPKFTSNCGYENGMVFLNWNKVTGAENYTIYRSKVNPSTGKVGAYSVWATTTKTSIKKTASGDYRYRVRANKGKYKTQFSNTKRILAASGYIKKISHDGKYIVIQLSITNKSASPMAFMYEWVLSKQTKIYLVNKTTKKVEKTLDGWLDNGVYGVSVARELSDNTTKALQFSTKQKISAADYSSYIKKYDFMIACSFYPNPNVEPITNQLAITMTKDTKGYSVSGK